jgi:hypothetical protein
MGDYEITNHVLDYQRNRRIGWEPVLSAASRAEDEADIGQRSGHRWVYELTAAEPGPQHCRVEADRNAGVSLRGLL